MLLSKFADQNPEVYGDIKSFCKELQEISREISLDAQAMLSLGNRLK